MPALVAVEVFAGSGGLLMPLAITRLAAALLGRAAEGWLSLPRGGVGGTRLKVGLEETRGAVLF